MNKIPTLHAYYLRWITTSWWEKVSSDPVKSCFSRKRYYLSTRTLFLRKTAFSSRFDHFFIGETTFWLLWSPLTSRQAVIFQVELCFQRKGYHRSSRSLFHRRRLLALDLWSLLSRIGVFSAFCDHPYPQNKLSSLDSSRVSIETVTISPHDHLFTEDGI